MFSSRSLIRFVGLVCVPEYVQVTCSSEVHYDYDVTVIQKPAVHTSNRNNIDTKVIGIETRRLNPHATTHKTRRLSSFLCINFKFASLDPFDECAWLACTYTDGTHAHHICVVICICVLTGARCRLDGGVTTPLKDVILRTWSTTFVWKM